MASTILSDNGVSSGSAGLKTTADSTGALALQTTTAGGTATNAVTIDTSQNVGIGVSPYGWTGLGPVLNVKTGTGAGTFIGTSVDNFRMLSNTYYDGAYKRIGAGYATAYEQAAGAHIWSTAGTSTAGSSFTFSESMRIDSSGNLLVNRTSRLNNGKIEVVASTSEQAIVAQVQTNANSVFQGFNAAGSVTFQATGTGAVYISGLGTGTVYSNSGNLTNTNPSDERLKADITDLSWGLAEILQLRPVSYFWKNNPTNQGAQYGFIAQEVQPVMPELVREFETEEDGETVTRFGLEKEGINAALVKAIQEQQALITSLTARITALENK